jgi:hypothetical protein
MKNLIPVLILAIALAGCSPTVTINPTVVASLPPPAATAVSGGATAVANATVPPPLTTVLATISPPPVTAKPITPLPPSVAGQVITIYARHQLGLQVEIIKAMGAAGELNLPTTTQANVQAALNLAGTSYAALLQGGIGLVALGGAEITGDVTANIDWASLGVFTLRSEAPYPADADAALALAKQTYPGIAQYDYTPQTVERGYSFIAVTNTSAVDPTTGETQNVAKVVIPGVIQTDQGLVFVYVIVANGSLSQPLVP